MYKTGQKILDDNIINHENISYIKICRCCNISNYPFLFIFEMKQTVEYVSIF